MFWHTGELMIALLMFVGQAEGDSVALAKKGQKQPAVTGQATNFVFSGTTLSFDQPGGSTQAGSSTVTHQASVNDWAIEIQLVANVGPSDEELPLGPTFTSNRPGLGPVNAPTFYDSVPQATKDVDTQRAQLQTENRSVATGAQNDTNLKSMQAPASAAFPTMHVGDLTSCKGRGQDWLTKTNDIQQTHVQGKIISISNGWLTFQSVSSTPARKYRLYLEVAAIGIGVCP